MAEQQKSAEQPRADSDAGSLPTFIPPADVFETDDALVMFVEIPGADPDGVDVTLEKRVLTVAARSKPFMPEGYALLYAEYRDGNYERAFTLSEEIDRERIDAVVKDGVLKLTLPKTMPSPAKKIAVKPA
jgi:HSP20 family protein